MASRGPTPARHEKYETPRALKGWGVAVDSRMVSMATSESKTNPPNPRCFALVPCAGTGSRAGTNGPKQYERIAGQPMVWHTLAAFGAVKRIARTLVVVAEGDGFFERNPTS